jgi:hypothetical protein
MGFLVAIASPYAAPVPRFNAARRRFRGRVESAVAGAKKNLTEPEQKPNFPPLGQSMVAFAQFLGCRPRHVRGVGG